jgi:N-acetylglucosaminyldiphosphoundecaprenol N-acetyl-beta-D-mannosaminyltransferase
VRVAEPEQRNGRAVVLGCAIDSVDMRTAVERCEQLVRAGGFGQHMAVNAAKLVAMHDDPVMRAVTERCQLVTADGQAVVWASRVLGDPLPERVAGIDLMEALFALAAERGYGVYILGARAEVLERAVSELRRRHVGLRVVGHRDGYFGADEEAAVAAEIRAARADMLFVAISSPRKEYFLGEHGPRLGVAFAMGVGGAIDVVAGETRRAPRWMQRLGLEWLYRLLQEPRRLLRRYATTNGRFVGLVAREWMRRRRGRR